MATLQATDIADLVNNSLNYFQKNRLTEITSDLQDHVAVRKLLSKSHVDIQGGPLIEYRFLHRGSNNFGWSGLYNRDNLNSRDGTAKATIPWRHWTTGATWDIREPIFNRGKAEINNFIKIKLFQMDVEAAEEMEEAFWSEPAGVADLKTPYGLKCHLTFGAQGFNGGNHPVLGAIGANRTTYPRMKNYTDTYVAVTKVDLITKMRRAMSKTNFKPTAPNPRIPSYNTGDKFNFYTIYPVLALFESSLESQNINLGNDIASKDGATLFRRIPVEDVPYLNENEATSAPVIGLNWGVFKTAVQSGRWKVKTPAKPSDNHNIIETFLDGTMNWYLPEPRRCFLIAKSDWSA